MEGAISSPSNKRIAVVTGGNKGIGLEICRQLASNGVMVILTARDEEKGKTAAEKLKGLGVSDIIFHQLEITEPSSITRLADFVKTQFGKLDILVNNAAIGGIAHNPVDASKPIAEQLEGKDEYQRIEWMMQNSKESYDQAKECLKTNYYGTKHVTEAFLPLLQSSSGRIVNVSSGFGLLRNFNNEELIQELNDIDNLTEERLDELLDLFLEDFKANLVEAHGWPTSGFSAYKVSKATLNAYSRILAKRYPALHVNCAHPGYVKTDICLQSGILTPEEGASSVVKVALLPDGGPTGANFDQTREASFV